MFCGFLMLAASVFILLFFGFTFLMACLHLYLLWEGKVDDVLSEFPHLWDYSLLSPQENISIWSVAVEFLELRCFFHIVEMMIA